MKAKDKIINRVTLRFPSLSENERFARLAVSGFVSALDPALDELSEIKTAVSEAVTNAVVHAYPKEIGVIQMRLRILSGDVLEIVVKDKGVGIPDVERARTPLFTTGGEERSGMGFTIMEGFTDKLRVRSAPGRGTTITMRRRLLRRS